MSLQTPRQRPGLQRPSYGTQSTTSPGLSASTTAVNRKASLQALTGSGHPKTPGSKADGGELEVGDAVNVPGEMYGTVKFVGVVKGKSGRFVGVELDKEFAAKGKNSGDVEGTTYFNTSIPGAGIFLPVHRAEKRGSPNGSGDSYPGTPNTPSYSTVNGHRTESTENKKGMTPAMPHKFAQSVGPGLRPASPTFKPTRPSITRPESPLRKNQPNLAPPPARTLSQSTQGRRPGATPSKTNLKSSAASRLPPGGPSPRPYSRTGSRLGRHDEDDDRTPVGASARGASSGSIPSFSQTMRSPSRIGAGGGQDQEVERLKKQLEERDRRLEEQAASLAEMETSVKELSSILPQDDSTPNGFDERQGSLSSDDDQTAAQLRQLLREKNEKISLLTTEFDSHRADFRSTLDSLEMASTETERVYEEQKRDLMAQLAEMQELSQSKEDFEDVATQLKQLEELVAELEEGLEESRRGEAEARGEVEFLRGEVERGRSELRREREKAAAGLTNGEGGAKRFSGSVSPSSKEMDKKDDEIRGLKAIIHGLSGSSPSTAQTPATTNGAAPSSEELQRLHDQLDDERVAREELESELASFRQSAPDHHRHARHQSDRTDKTPTGDDHSVEEVAPLSMGRRRADTVKPAAAASPVEKPAQISSEKVYCEMCASASHDTLECSQLNPKHDSKHSEGTDPMPSSPAKADKENESPGKAESAEKADVKNDGDKWCALCEKDGHLAFDCPEEQY